MERINPGQKGNFRYAVLDFDGTISLIREGWQKIMVPYFIDELSKAPGAKEMSAEDISYKVRDFVTVLTGKQTIYQCIRLAEEITALGGTPEDPQVYKDEYQRRLLVHIDERLKGLEDGSIDPETLTVPGSYDLLDMLLRGYEEDPLGQVADSHAGAMSIMIGIAANVSMKEGRQVQISELMNK